MAFIDAGVDKLSTSILHQLIEVAFSQATGHMNNEDWTKNIPSNNWYSAMRTHTTFLQSLFSAAKYNSPTSVFQQALETQEFPEDAIEIVTRLYEKNVSTIRNAMYTDALPTVQIPRLLDVSYMPEYTIRSSTHGKVTEPTIRLRFTLFDGVNVIVRERYCDTFTLDQLATEAHEACHAVETLSASH